jgi:hypothetical protein
MLRLEHLGLATGPFARACDLCQENQSKSLIAVSRQEQAQADTGPGDFHGYIRVDDDSLI